ncbi:MAG: NAD-dependent epimerase/dehydratase [Rhodospirillales bacterium]|nr:NAD-dependent epimerase/dehydratase [Rhodospirillales bacterium]
MRILITGAAGMIGRKLAEQLAQIGRLGDQAISVLTLTDVVPPVVPAGFAGLLELDTADLATPDEATRLIAGRPDVIFHTAGIVSGEAESDFNKGYRVNLDGSRLLLAAIRQEGQAALYRPRLVFTSSIAVFGAPFPDTIDDDFLTAPLTSYGTQKAMVELLLSDYTRRGFVDGVGLRLPTICVRPGIPNKAASGFFSSIIREPLAAREAVLPVSGDVRAWHASPRAAIGFLLHAATLDAAMLGARRNMNMPGLSVTVDEQIAALRRVAGDGAVQSIRREFDPTIAKMVDGWPQAFDAARALALGFRADSSFDEIIQNHIDDEMSGSIAKVAEAT